MSKSSHLFVAASVRISGMAAEEGIMSGKQPCGSRLQVSASLCPAESISSDDAIFEEYLRPVLLKVKDNGLFSYEYTDGLSNVKIYYRSDPWENERLLNKALPELYKGFGTDN